MRHAAVLGLLAIPLMVIGCAMRSSTTTDTVSSSATSTSASTAGGSIAGGAGGLGGDGGASGEGGHLACAHCGLGLAGKEPESALCPTSLIRLHHAIACICDDACAPLCHLPGAPNCFATWWASGTFPSDCNHCISSPTGCKAALDECFADDGTGHPTPYQPPPPCSCPEGIPLCPGGGECPNAGPWVDGGANGACGDAQYCDPCCDTGGGCAIHGNCQLTKLQGKPCAEAYECYWGKCLLPEGVCGGP